MRILVVDDEKNIRRTLTDILVDEGYDVVSADSGEKALDILSREWVDLVILDVKLPGMDGIQVFRETKEIQAELDVLMISGHSGIETAVEAVKLGAYDFLEKPLSMAKILTAARNISEKRNLLTRLQEGETSDRSRYRLVGESPQMVKIRQTIGKVARTDSKVLIRGESGAGKELIAFAIHEGSRRTGGPFVKFNSAAIPNELVESELFGHEKGAFTGADRQKLGKLEIADAGTLFLDEIGDMSDSAQAKVLRVVEEGKFQRVGGNKTIAIDVRIVAATNKDLETMIQKGTFREDLYYRLNVVPVVIPPLREREGDIEILTDYFLRQFSVELKIPPKRMDVRAQDRLKSYPFPGNVRELKNLIERLYILTVSDSITEEDILPFVSEMNRRGEAEGSLFETRDFKVAKREFEIRYLTTQLKKHDWNISSAARELGMHQSNLSRKMKELGIKRD
ncbi:MAG: sigma-54 dependent transcriptional regulator [Candidatus Neomarinimicrobiota bacterium]